MTSQLPNEFATYRYKNGKATSVPAPLPTALGPKDVILRISHSGVCHVRLSTSGSDSHDPETDSRE